MTFSQVRLWIATKLCPELLTRAVVAEAAEALTRTRLAADCEELLARAVAAEKRAEEAERQLDLIDAINEDDWESGEAASWVAKIRAGESVEDTETQEQYEESYCTGRSRDFSARETKHP